MAESETAAEKVPAPTLVVLAAGMGSRYGGLKQIDPVGPSGEVVLDYSVYDAIEAGFRKVIFIIRRDIEDDFRDALEAHFIGKISVDYAYQELDDLPADLALPDAREKPWGTGHALLACEELLDEPFAVINADDYYGKTSFKLMADKLRLLAKADNAYCMVGFRLKNTLSEHGGVSRGVCQVSISGYLENIEETHGIVHDEQGTGYELEGTRQALTGEELVSMNMWGFTPGVFKYFKDGFVAFLNEMKDPLKSEFLIPTVVDELISDGEASVEVIISQDPWYGVTYPEDKPYVQKGIGGLVRAGLYPKNLWKE